MKRLKLLLFFILSSLSVFLVPLYQFQTSFYARDWGLFNTLSHFVRSSWLNYHQLPMHNPYHLGGMDVLADPQSKVFSPLAIFDLFFQAPYANLLSLFILSVLGGYGMYKLLTYLGFEIKLSLLGSFLYVHLSWFSLHFSEGHIIFGSFQLLSLVLYFTVRIQEPKFKVYLAGLLAFMLLDGGFYAFIYSVLIVLFSFVFRFQGLSFSKFTRSIFHQVKTSLFAIGVFVGISSAKLVPFLMLHRHRTPVLESIQLDLQSLALSLFYPNQWVLLRFPEASYRDYGLNFHEIGAYFGVLSFTIVLWFVIKAFRKNLLPLFLFILLFLWIGTGFGGVFNPWTIFQKIPVINNAHVQTRALIVVNIFLLLLLIHAIKYLSTKVSKKGLRILFLVLVVESIYVSTYPYIKLFSDADSISKSKVFEHLIASDNVDKTVANAGYFRSDGYLWGHDFDLFLHRNAASRSLMDPAVVRGDIKVFDEKGYRGEAYLLQGRGKVKLIHYSPGEITVDLTIKEPAIVQFNTNYLLGWKSDNPNVKIYDKQGLLTISLDSDLVKKVKLTYSPPYYPIIVWIYLISLFVFLTYVYLVEKKGTMLHLLDD